MSNNSNLHKAKKARNDEFYTQYEDIEKEIQNYNLEGKKIYCNCDDYRYSNFVKYFKDNFNRLKISYLTASNYDNGECAYKYEYDGVEEVRNMPGVAHIHLSYEVGKTIDENTIGRLAQVGARVLITANNKCKLLETMDRIQNTLKAISTEGNNMFITNYSYQSLCK